MQSNYYKKILKTGYQNLFDDLKLQGYKLVFTNGCFDILHKGHIKTLSEAKNTGDILVVGINDDASVNRLKGPGRPVVPLDSRMAVLASLEFVDYVIPFSEDTPLEVIKSVRPDVLIKGSDYKEDEIVGREIVIKSGGFVKIIEQVPGISSSEIIEKIKKSS